MGLRCLLGHEYANREVEREREERGDEMVVTYRTVETCERCGERRVVSENKEVRAIRHPAEDEVTTGLGGGGGVTPDMGDEADEERASGDADPATQPSVEASGEQSPDAPDDGPDESVDDAVILDDSGEELPPGEWPDADDPVDADDGDDVPDADADGATVVDAGDEWPAPEGEDEGFDAEPGGAPTDVEFGGGLTPDAAAEAEAGTGAEAETEAAAANGQVAGKQFVAAESVERVGNDADAETEFFCPNCGHARTAGGSSMRAGDICPDCHQGYIAERER